MKDTVVVKTENGEEFIGNIKNVDIDEEVVELGRWPVRKSREYTFNVGGLINVDTGEEY
jgi:small nuclear ribonucleoprotein (snRNP)-like protein